MRFPVRLRSLKSRWFAAGFFALGSLAALPARAQTWMSTSYKSGEPWSDGTKWVGGVAPANNGTANVIFSQSSATNVAYLDANWNVASVYFNSTPGLTYGGSGTPSVGNAYGVTPTLTIQQGGITNASTYAITINPALAVAQPQTWNVGTGGALTVYNVSGAGAISKTGAGKLSFASPQNAFTGGITVGGGTVVTTNGPGLGPDGSPVALQNGATLSFITPINVSPPYSIALNHPLTIGPGGGTITTFDGSTTFNSPISGSGALTLGPDTIFSASTTCSYVLGVANSHAGGTIIGPGVTATVASAQQVFGTGGVTVQSGGALVLGAASNLAPGRTITLQPATASQYASALVLTDASLNPAALVDPASTGGVVALGGFTDGTPLDFSTIGNGKLALGTAGTSVYSALTLGAGSDGVYRLGGGANGGSLTLNGAANLLTGSRAVAIGDYGVYQSGLVPTGATSAGIILPFANDYTGGTALNDGTLHIGDDHSLGSGALTFGSARLQADGGARTLANPVQFNAAGGSISVIGTNGVTFTGPVDLGGGTRQIFAGAAPVIFTNVIRNGSVILSSATATFAAANTFSALTVNSALLSFASDGSLGAAGATLTLGGGTLIPLASGLTLNRPVNVTGSYSAINTNGGTVTITGAVTGNINASLGKSGAGTLVLTNPNSTEPLTVNAGTLQMDNSSGDKVNGVQVTVNAGATLAGTGTVGYTTLSKAHLAPGDNGPGTLTVISALNLYNAAILDFDLGTQAADQVIISGHYFDVDTNGGPIVVNFKDTGGLAPGQTYNLINWGTAQTYGVTASAFQLGSSPVGGTFSVASNGSLQFTTVAYTPFQQWQSTYFGSVNNAAAKPNANPAGDGISNLLKYALGLDPRYGGAGGLPQVSFSGGYLTLTYTRPLSVTDVAYNPQASDDLVNWSNSGVTQDVLSTDGGIQTVRARVALGTLGHRFIRLSVNSQ